MVTKYLRRAVAPLAVGIGAFLIASCGPPGASYEDIPDTGATLEGTVTYKKEPLELGMVMLSGPGGGGTGSTGSIGEGGKYKVARAPIGEVGIGVTTAAAIAQARGEAMGGAVAAKDAKGLKKFTPKMTEVPAKYGNPSTSGIKTTIKSGSNTYDIVLD